MEKPRKGRFRKTLSKLRRNRQHTARDKKNGVHGTGENDNSTPPPLSLPMSAYSDDISEDSELSTTTNPSCEMTVDLPKPREDESANTSEKELCPITVDITSANSRKRLKDMSWEGHQKLTYHLQPLVTLGNDYRMLADKMGFGNEDIKFLGSTNDPVKELITKYDEKGDRKIVELMSLLKDIERPDVVQDLQKYLDETPTPEEVERRVQTRVENDELRTRREFYDAFVCFAKEDQEFVDRLVETMEGAPYNLHLCLSERDFLPGGSIFDTTAVAIEKRCKRFVVILSRHFDNSEGSQYESHIAMNLSPGAKQNRLIPVLIDEAYRSRQIPRPFSHLNYLDWLRLEEKNAWDKLADSLGWKGWKQNNCRAVIKTKAIL